MRRVVRIRDRRRGVVVTARLGDGVPKVTGYGGWEAIARPKRDPMTDWPGGVELGMSVPLLLDGFRTDTSVQRDFDRLEAMARKRGEQRPPTVKLDGPIPHTDEIWVIVDLDWGDLHRNDDGELVRQALTLVVMRHQEGDVVLSPAKRKREQGGGSLRKPYTVKKGDTLRSIAAKQLGDARRWQQIALLNLLRDPNKLKVGQKLRLPK